MTEDPRQDSAPLTGRSLNRSVLAPSFVIALAMGGDGLLYAVLPLYAQEFGVSLFMVGVLLSINRWVRLFANGYVARLSDSVGWPSMMLWAAVGAVVSTLVYALADNETLLLAARVLWGVCFAALNLGSIAYATIERRNAGKRLATTRVAIGLCQAFNIVLGGILVATWDAQLSFLVVACISSVGIVIATQLSPLAITTSAAVNTKLPIPNRIELWAFVAAVVLDGIFVFTIALLLVDVTLPVSPVIAAALILGARWGMEVITAPVGGTLVDRLGPKPFTLAVGVIIVIGFLLIAAQQILLGAVLVVVVRGLLNTALPVLMVDHGKHGGMQDQAGLATWRDFGAAVGPILAGAIYGLLPDTWLYLASAILLAVVLVIGIGGLKPAAAPMSSVVSRNSPKQSK